MSGRVVVGAPDARLTGHPGLAVVAELDRVSGIAPALDGAVGSIKTRRRGVSAGGLLLSMARYAIRINLGDGVADTSVRLSLK